MENIDSLLRLVRIDWEETQSLDFNPLSLAFHLTDENSQINDNFRNIYHKIERGMMTIIETSFKGFSDSILSYKKCFLNVNLNIKTLRDMKFDVEEISKSVNVDLKILSKQKKLIQKQNELIEKLEQLIDLRNSINETHFENLEDGAYNILHCLALYKTCSSLKPVRLVHHDIDKKKAELIGRILKDVVLFVVGNHGSVLFSVRSIFILELYSMLDKALLIPIRSSLIRNIQNKINESQKKDCNEKEQLKCSARYLNSYLKTVISKYDDLMKKINKYRKRGDNFFEKDYIPTGFFKRSIFIDIIKKEMFKLINSFTVHSKDKTYDKFMIDEIEENDAISKLLDKKINLSIKIHNRKQSDENQSVYEIYVENGIDFIFYLYENIFQEIKPELYKYLKHNYYLKKEKKVEEKIENMFESKFMKLENKKSALVPRIKQFVCENDYYGLDFGSCNFLSIFNSIVDGYNTHFKVIYKSKVFLLFFSDDQRKESENKNDDDDVNEKFLKLLKTYLNTNRISSDDCFQNLKYREIGLCLNLSIKEVLTLFMNSRNKYESIEVNPKIADLELHLKNIYQMYEISFYFQFIIDVLFFFDQFYRNGIYGKNDPFLREIINLIQNLYNLGCSKTFYIHGLFDIIEYFIFTNMDKLNVSSIEDLKAFIDDLKTFEEIVSNFEMCYEKGFEVVLAFYDSILSKQLDTQEKRDIAKKIGLK